MVCPVQLAVRVHDWRGVKRLRAICDAEMRQIVELWQVLASSFIQSSKISINQVKSRQSSDSVIALVLDVQFGRLPGSMLTVTKKLA